MWTYLDDSNGYAGAFFGELGATWAEAGQSKHCYHVVSWLTRARSAYQAAGGEADWRAYFSEIRDR